MLDQRDQQLPQGLRWSQGVKGIFLNVKSAACLIVKNEGTNILEWIAFHKVIGFDTIFVIDDRSLDDTKTVAASCAAAFDVRVLDLAFDGLGRQAKQYQQVCFDYKGEFDWIAFFDSDEFLVPDGSETLAEMLVRNMASSAIAVPWRMFGSSGHTDKPKGLVIEEYINRSRDDFAPTKHVKSIVKPSKVIKSENPHYFQISGEYVLPNGNKPVWKQLGVLDQMPPTLNWYLNHYFTRSFSHWQDRMARGQLGQFVRTAQDFEIYDRNEVPDTRAASMAGAVKEKIQSIPS